MPQARTDQLVSLARYNSPTEGAIALARLEAEGIQGRLGSDTTATWLSYMGPNIAATELFVRESDAAQAREILSAVGMEQEEDAALSADDEEATTPTTPLSRAFRAAIISWFLLPPILNFYSCWLIVRHRLWETDDNWRYCTTIAFNMFGFAMGWWLWRSILGQSL